MESRMIENKNNSKRVLKEWIFLNRYKLITVILIYQFSIVSIGISNFPYIDDIDRQIKGYTGFASGYSRWGSEIGSWILNGNRHLADLGLTTFIITGIFLSIASIIAVYALNEKKLEWISIFSSILIGTNPWFLACTSFRFDSPYMALSVLASFAPFLWWDDKRKFFFSSILCVLLMCNTYQSSSGIFIIMVIALAFKHLISGGKFVEILKKTILAAFSYIISMLLFVVQTKFNPNIAMRGETVEVAGILEIPSVVKNNIFTYFSIIFKQSNPLWIFLFSIVVILFFITFTLKSEVNIFKSIIYSLLYFLLASILSYGVYLIFPFSLITLTPRYGYGFAIFFSITLILLSSKKTLLFLDLSNNLIVCLFFYYLVTFTFMFSSTMVFQKEAFERQSIILASDLKDLVNPNRKTIYMNRLFKDAPVFENNKINYPILGSILPSNTELSWTNTLLFNVYSNLDVSINNSYYDFSNFDYENNHLEITNYYYDIFTKDNEIFILMK